MGQPPPVARHHIRLPGSTRDVSLRRGQAVRFQETKLACPSSERSPPAAAALQPVVGGIGMAGALSAREGPASAATPVVRPCPSQRLQRAGFRARAESPSLAVDVSGRASSQASPMILLPDESSEPRPSTRPSRLQGTVNGPLPRRTSMSHPQPPLHPRPSSVRERVHAVLRRVPGLCLGVATTTLTTRA